jgi:uncharacterized repeat protein (TIGR03803 family)
MTRLEPPRTRGFGTNLRASAFALALAIVFALTVAAAPAAQGQTFKVIHTFTGGADGASPVAGLTMDRGGRFYGTTYGSPSAGSVFKLASSGPGWALFPLNDFRLAGGGANPASEVVFGSDGNLYGTTFDGGLAHCGGNDSGCGVVFELQPPPTVCALVLCPWTEIVLYTFGELPDGETPNSGVVFDKAGSLYGTTLYGGTGSCADGAGCGVVYKLTPSGGGWTEQVLYSFQGGSNDGELPYGGLIFDQAGNLYGTALDGGSAGDGVIYELTPSSGGWTETILHAFQGSDGSQPFAGLIADKSGNLYGVASGGGSANGGAAFELSNPGHWTYTLLYSFAPGSDPYAPLTFDSVGNLYGTTSGLGSNENTGTVFRLTPSNGGWAETDLHDFTGFANGAYPLGGVTLDANGNLYGTTLDGGPFGTCSLGCGVVWEITP